ncbi:MAG: 2-oxoglutarate dehydrogenase E1 component [Gammaproteobacteria bacterium]|nr:2-oxoglutarate dehydrogenase E1 component [Gammaproteobacteria bacterium]
MSALWASSQFTGNNAPYLEELYEQYLRDPNSVSPEWRSFFTGLPQVNGIKQDVIHSEVRQYFRELAKHPSAITAAKESVESLEYERKQEQVFELIDAYRFRGHQHAKLDPLKRHKLPEIPDLTLRHHQLSVADLDTEFATGSLHGPPRATLAEILEIVNATYCGSIGAEYMYITASEEKNWIQQQLESVQGKPQFDVRKRKKILQDLTAAEGLETYLHSKYVGQKRFSLEGAESLIPMLNEIVQSAGTMGVKEVVMAMAHRGRLNVLVNIMGKLPSDLFQEFEGKKPALNGHYSGDVKYHMGFSSDIKTPGGNTHLTLAFNPSHLEIVSPVIQGSVRSRQDRRQDSDGQYVLPISMHGDAAFAGQGVVMETFNMSQSRGFSTKGTVHIVINNQIGFTTSYKQDARSTVYCTDVAKMVSAPIFHVNGDDPEAVIFVTQLALNYRMKFKKDVVIDMVCYRRHGHNEADEPSATQPMMYKKIKALATTRKQYAERLTAENIFSEEETDLMAKEYRDMLDAGLSVQKFLTQRSVEEKSYVVDWSVYFNREWDQPVDTKISLDRLKHLSDRLLSFPDGLELHSRVNKIMADRQKMAAGSLPIDWGFAEIMAYASLVTEGVRVRISGQDSGRGTFFHRHAVLHNQRDGTGHVPLRHIAKDQAKFLVVDSVLSEEAVLAFEYGYSTNDPHSLVIWEAQFGDFANGAQVVIDQFISSGEQKWGRLSGLVLLLPHGYEGQGPEHSSARMERFLQLCAEHNMQVCSPTTPAQAFHMLRRQALRQWLTPLIVMSPKSLLRHKQAVSSLEDLTQGCFMPVLGDEAINDPEKVKKLILCNGKVYYDLIDRRRTEVSGETAIIRIEQLYPFPEVLLQLELDKYAHAEDVVWCQEEPMNQGAWYSSQHHIRGLLREDLYLRYVGRAASASPAVGYGHLHVQQQKELVEKAFA